MCRFPTDAGQFQSGGKISTMASLTGSFALTRERSPSGVQCRWGANRGGKIVKRRGQTCRGRVRPARLVVTPRRVASPAGSRDPCSIAPAWAQQFQPPHGTPAPPNRPYNGDRISQISVPPPLPGVISSVLTAPVIHSFYGSSRSVVQAAGGDPHPLPSSTTPTISSPVASCIPPSAPPSPSLCRPAARHTRPRLRLGPPHLPSRVSRRRDWYVRVDPAHEDRSPGTLRGSWAAVKSGPGSGRLERCRLRTISSRAGEGSPETTGGGRR